jgi:hypothetical protein
VRMEVEREGEGVARVFDREASQVALKKGDKVSVWPLVLPAGVTDRGIDGVGYTAVEKGVEEKLGRATERVGLKGVREE